ncbi:hypothetical protein HN371_06460, partial [Candidatus Poribacteria bacterium]|nr:hypothetical protein [Candidatus Poribacteria bacterium]
MKKVTVLGYGNELRGDQVAGRVVAEAIASRRMPGVRVATTRMLTRGHIPLIADADMVIFVGTYDADKVEPVRVARVRLGKTASGYVKDPASLMEMVSQRQGHAPEAWSVMVPATHRGLQAPPSPQAEEAIDEAIMH